VVLDRGGRNEVVPATAALKIVGPAKFDEGRAPRWPRSSEVQYELSEARNGRGDWVVRIAGDQVTTEPGRTANPVVTMRMSVPVFARIAARELHPGKALIEGQMQVEGDYAAAARLGEMFGADSLV
jgi:putative sterol carrier protein